MIEITRREDGDFTELVLKGRIDGPASDRLAAEIEDSLRIGADRIRLDMADVTYINSTGIRVLLKSYKDLRKLAGALLIARPSAPVKQILETVQLLDMLAPAPAVTPVTEPGAPAGRLDRPAATYEVFGSPGIPLKGRLVGDPTLLDGFRFTREHCRSMTFPASTMAFGMGAFGSEFAECERRFGEFLAVGGAAAAQSTDAGKVADSLATVGGFTPELQVLYALVCEGSLDTMLRFEGKPEAEPIPFSELATVALEASGTDTIAMVVVAQTAGLVGAALRESPAHRAIPGAPFRFPDIRRWLSFSTDSVHSRALSVVCGVVSRRPEALPAMLRPMAGGSLQGHVHAAAFPYRRLAAGRLDLNSTIETIFDGETARGVLHLLDDDRTPGAPRESRFLRGAVWTGPLVIA